MVKRIVAIILIFICASIAWGVLGATIFSRTYSSDDSLKDSVVSIWGAPQRQTPPTASFLQTVPRRPRPPSTAAR